MDPTDQLKDLGLFAPSIYNQDTVEREFTQRLKTAGYRMLESEIRPPDHDRYLAGAGPRLWHQDNYGGLLRRQFVMAVWANKMPTDIRALDGEVKVMEPFHLYCFDNATYEHRVPLEAKLNDGRWFARAYIQEAA